MTHVGSVTFRDGDMSWVTHEKPAEDVPAGYLTALGRDVWLRAGSNRAAVRTRDGVIEFPAVGPAVLSHAVTIPTADGPRTFVGPDEDGCFREVFE